jgi:hypothetical protein
MEEKYLKDLRDHTKETLHLLSGHEMKPERERSVCRAFLRCAGVPFTEESIIASRDEPPDVLFDLARFEVLEVLDDDRRRGDELKEEVERVEKAKSIDDVLLPLPSPKFIRLAELVPLVKDKLKGKFKKYAKDVRGKLDVLVYVNMCQTFFVPTSPGVSNEEYDTKNLGIQGWQSVSVLALFSPTENPDFLGYPCHHAVVLTATATAPKFIHDRLEQILNMRSDQDGLFEP